MRRLLVVAPIVVVLALLVLFLRSRTSARELHPGASASASAAGSAAAAAPSVPVVSEATTVRDLDDDPAGALRLEGQVVDEEERPVGGARVTISTRPARVITSEADGSFALTGLLPRAYTLSARAGDRLGGPVTARVSEKTEPVILRLAAGATLAVSVEDATRHAPLAGARVVALDGFHDEPHLTDAAGRAALTVARSARVRVRAEADGFAIQETEVVTPAAGVVAVAFQLSAGALAEGLVVDEDGHPVAGATVRALPAALAEAGALTATSSADGAWRIAGLRPGSYRFFASDAAHAPATSALVLVRPAGTPPTRLTVRAGGVIAGRVEDADGHPVAFAQVRAASGAGSLTTLREASSDAEGAFSLAGLPRADVDVVASSEHATSAVQTIPLGATAARRDVVLRLDQSSTIRGLVVDAKGAPLPEVQVFAVPEAHEGGPLGVRASADVSASDGSFAVSGLAPGAYRLRATRSPALARRLDFWTRPGVLARAGDTGVRVLLEDVGSIRGRVVFASGVAPERFAVATGTYAAPVSVSGSDGAFVLHDVPAGRTALVVTGPDLVRTSSDELEVVAGVETDAGVITVARGRSVAGKVVRADGTPSVGAQVIAGQRIVGDGTSLKVFDPNAPVTGAKSATTDAQGGFRLDGLDARALVVAADHDEDGRAAPQAIPAGDADVSLVLHLAAASSLEGTISDGGQLLENVSVIAQALAASSARFKVTTGPDGTYRFDRLAVGAYLLSVVRSDGSGNNVWVSEAVEVGPTTTRHDLNVADEDLSLAVQVVSAAGKPVDSAVVFLVSGAISAPDYAALSGLLGTRPGRWDQGFLVKGLPGHTLVLPELRHGEHTLCVVPLPVDLETPGAGDWLRLHMETLPMTCAPQPVPAATTPVRFVVP